jgi:nitrate/nitrite transporter NarK
MSADTAAGGIALASALGGFSEPSLIGTIEATTGGFEDALFLLGGFTAAAAVLGLLATRHESRRVQSDAKAKLEPRYQGKARRQKSFL